MNVNTTIPVADTLEKELTQKGHIWLVEDRVRAATREELQDDGFLRAFRYGLWVLIDNQWGIKTNMYELDELIADLAVRIHNLDLDGRSAEFPPNRYNTL